MPVLNGRIYVVKAGRSEKDGQFQIPFTKERFIHKYECEKQMKKYKQKMWCCRSTFKSGLTYLEALDSEKEVKSTLKKQFPLMFEKPVLELVHHNSGSIDAIVHNAYKLIATEFVVGDEVQLISDDSISGKIVKVTPQSEPPAPPVTVPKENGDDKENDESEKENVKYEKKPYLYDIEIKSDSSDEEVMRDIPASDIERTDENYTIPKKRLLKLFIRSNAVRVNYKVSSPWIVDDKMREKYGIPNKLCSLFLLPRSKGKIPEPSSANKAAINRIGLPGSKSSHKKNGGAGASGGSKDCKTKLTKIGKLTNRCDLVLRSPVKPKTDQSDSPAATVEEEETEGVLQVLVRSPRKRPRPLETNGLSNSLSSANGALGLPEGAAAAGSEIESDASMIPSKKKKRKKASIDCEPTLFELAMGEALSPQKKMKQSLLLDSRASGSKSQQVPSVLSESDLVQTADAVMPSPEEVAKRRFEHMKAKLKMYRGQVNNLANEKEAKRYRNLYNEYACIAAKSWTIEEVKSMDDDDIVDDLLQRQERIQERQKLMNMSEDEKAKYLHAKRLQSDKEKRQKKNQERLRASLKYEDKELSDAKPLPEPNLVPTPDDFPNELFGNAAFVAEFCAAYSGLIIPAEEQFKISCDKLIQALVSGKSGYEYLSKLLVLLLKTLLQDEITDNYKELGLKLSEIPVNAVSALELSRLCLKGRDDGASDDIDGGSDDGSKDDDDSFYECDFDDVLLQELESSDFPDLKPHQKCQVLSGLVNRILSTYSLVEHQEEKQNELKELYKERNRILMEKNRDLKQKKEKKKAGQEPSKSEKPKADEGEKPSISEAEKPKTTESEAMPEAPTETKEDPEKETSSQAPSTSERKPVSGVSGNGTLFDYYQPDGPNNNNNNNNNGTSEQASGDGSINLLADQEQPSDLASVVKRRRLVAAAERQKKEEEDRQERVRREKEQEENEKQNRINTIERRYHAAGVASKNVIRLQPLGTDRNHARYWVFTSSTPGLFIEKGWIPNYIAYNVEYDEDASDNSNDQPSTNGDDVAEIHIETNAKDDETAATSDKVNDKDLLNTSGSETGVPIPGQNLWFHYDSPSKLDDLLASLHPNGIRESLLKLEIQRRYNDVKQSMIDYGKEQERKARADEKQTTESGADIQTTSLMERLVAELTDTEVKIRQGGLGGVPDFDAWTKKLANATGVNDLAECLLETEAGIQPRFMDGLWKLTEHQRKELLRQTSTDTDVADGTEEESSQDASEEISDVVKEYLKAGYQELVDKRQKRIDTWKDAVSGAQTLSKLGVLLGVLDACVKWDKSVEFARCRICRKKKDDDKLLLCDSCNNAYHMYCIRPALLRIPKGDWFCMGCKPMSPRKENRRRKSYVVNSSSEDEEECDSGGEEEGEESVEIEHEEECTVCNTEGNQLDELVMCCKCPSVFHKSCHQPPLRHMPRGNWVCCQCTTGKRIKPSKKGAQRRGGRASKKVVVSADDDDSSDEWEPKRSSGRTRAASRRAVPKKSKVEVESSEEEDEEDDDEEDNEQEEGGSDDEEEEVDEEEGSGDDEGGEEGEDEDGEEENEDSDEDEDNDVENNEGEENGADAGDEVDSGVEDDEPEVISKRTARSRRAPTKRTATRSRRAPSKTAPVRRPPARSRRGATTPVSQSESDAQSDSDDASTSRKTSPVRESSRIQCRMTRAAIAESERAVVTQKCDDVMKQIISSRLANCLLSFPKEFEFTGGKSDLTAIKNSIKRYRSFEDFMKDLAEIIERGKDVYSHQPRKLEALMELEILLTRIESNE